MAESARSINVEDINRVTGYDPDEAKYNEGTNNVYQWDNKVTYTLNNDTYIHYQGTKYPIEDKKSTYQTFEYWNGSSWETLKNETGKNSVTITHDYYWYNPRYLSKKDSVSSETTINGSIKADILLFAGTDSNYYWLSSQYVDTDEGDCHFGVGYFYSYGVDGLFLYTSNGEENSTSFGVRPVVSLKSNVKVTESGTLSI